MNGDGGVITKRAIPLLALALAGCATLGSPMQTMYEAYGGYDVALKGAVTYANSPTANPAIVAKLNAANKSGPVQAAVRYGHAYTMCNGSNTTIVAGVDCSLFDFRAGTVSGYVKTLRGVIATLTSR